MKIGFIGVGVMGKSMVRNLQRAGHEVTIYTRTKTKVEDVLSEGIQWCDSISQCATGRDAVITMVGYPQDVEEVYFGEGGILSSADPGTGLIDMTTTSPKLSVAIYEAAQAKGLEALDAPVSGGDSGAKNGTLSIMVGGEKAVFDKYFDLFQALGTNIIYEGPVGHGQHTKMTNQIALSGIITSLCEALVYAEKVGLDADTMLKSISAGAAGSWQMSNMGPRILQGDLNPGFFIKHYLKDMNIALEEAEAAGLHLELLQKVRDQYQTLADQGHGDDGTQAMIRYYK